MNTKPIPQARALTILGEDGAILPDVRARILRLFEEKKRAYRQNIQYRNLCVIGFIVSMGAMLVLGAQGANKETAAMVGVLAAFAFGFGGVYFELTRGSYKRLLFSCPYCDVSINLLERWVCGNCRKTNNDENHEFSSVFHECEEEVCSSPRQTAFVCPKCERHIILDKARYDELNSAKSPHLGVAVLKTFGQSLGALVELAEKLESAKSGGKNKQFFDN